MTTDDRDDRAQGDLDEPLGPYTLKKKIAEGGMATIFLADKTGPGGFGKQLVIKRILPHLADDTKFVEMFLDEARNAANFNHPNIVQIYDFGKADTHYFIAMEFIDGYDLAAVAERVHHLGRRIPPVIAARLIADALGGLDYAHAFTDPRSGEPLHLVHRDISPHNLLVNKDGNVKLVDFGVAKARTSSAKTQTGAVKGKFSYMAPEQIAGEHLDGRADIFAMGITLYEICVGKRPFGDVSEMMAINAILTRPPIPSREAGANLPPDLEAIIFKALEKDRNQRFHSAMEMQADLEVFIQNSSPRPITTREVGQFLKLLFANDIKGLDDFEAKLKSATTSMGVVTTRNTATPSGKTPAIDHSLSSNSPQITQGSSKGLMIGIVVVLLLLVGGAVYLILILLESKPSDPPKDPPSEPTTVASNADVQSPPVDVDVQSPPTTLAATNPTTSAPTTKPTAADVQTPPTVADVQTPPTVADVQTPPTVADVQTPPTVADTHSAPTVVDTYTPPPAVVMRKVKVSSPHLVALIDASGSVLLRRLEGTAEVELPVGKQQLSIRALSGKFRPESTFSVEVTADTTALPPFDFVKVSFELSTVPSDNVEILLDDHPIGKSPFAGQLEWIEGEHTVELRQGSQKQIYEKFKVDHELRNKRLIINLKENKFRIR